MWSDFSAAFVISFNFSFINIFKSVLDRQIDTRRNRLSAWYFLLVFHLKSCGCPAKCVFNILIAVILSRVNVSNQSRSLYLPKLAGNSGLKGASSWESVVSENFFLKKKRSARERGQRAPQEVSASKKLQEVGMNFPQGNFLGYTKCETSMKEAWTGNSRLDHLISASDIVFPARITLFASPHHISR